LSYKIGCVDTEKTKKTCKEINAHFFRNWNTTTCSTNSDKLDNILKDSYASKEKVDLGKDFFDVFGWTASYNDSNYNNLKMFQVGERVKTKAVFQAYVDEKSQNAKAAAASKALTEKVAEQARCQAASDPTAVSKAKAAID